MIILKFKTLCILIALFLSSAFAATEIIHKQYYTLNYNEDHEVANWVSYELEKNQLQNCVKRRNNFRADPEVSTGSAQLSDYKGSGFDRGHLVPAGDMKFNSQAMSETFYMSNMSPQPPKFNQVRWGQLEYLIRAWAFHYNRIWIVTGPILHNGLSTIGKTTNVSVPEEYYKVILKKEGNSYQGIAFLMHTSVPYTDLSAYVVSIDEVERLSGHDFFQFLDNRMEERVESQVNMNAWNFNARFEYLPCQTSVIQ